MENKFIVNNAKLLCYSRYILPSNTECTICRCNLNANSLCNESLGRSIVVIGQCNHSFHKSCIDPWVNKNNHCPLCFKIWKVARQLVD
jgi:hypothetical protein